MQLGRLYVFSTAGAERLHERGGQIPWIRALTGKPCPTFGFRGLGCRARMG
jgi:hypothetical protein